MKTLSRIIHRIDVSRHISHHLIGKEHSQGHRRIVGMVVMMIGVCIVKSSTMIDITIIHFISDVIGYGIHGLGLIPFASNLESK